jgi:hypothetical protein
MSDKIVDFDTMVKLKDEIIAKKTLLMSMLQAKELTYSELSEYVKKVKGVIANMVDANNKAVYGNPEKRDAAFVDQIKNDVEYENYENALSTIKKNIMNIELEIEDKEMMFKIYDIITR